MAEDDDRQQFETSRRPADGRRRRKAAGDTPATVKRTGAKGSRSVQRVRQTAKPVTSALADGEHAIAERGAIIAGEARSAARSTRRAAAKATKSVAAAPAAGRHAAKTGVKQAGKAARSRTATTLGAAVVGLVAGVAINLGRAVAVQAPSALAGDWFDAVKAEHKMALSLFDAMEETSNTEAGKRSTLLTQSKHALAKHAFMEENVLYPALRVSGDKADADKLNQDHGYVEQYLYDLENLDNRSPAFLRKVAEFRSEIEEHMRKEEQTIFPPLHAALSQDENAALTTQANKEAFKLA